VSTLERTAAGARAAPGGAACPSCGGRGLEPFYEQERVPVHSCQLVDTAAAARAFGRGTLRLAVCPRCGFIANTAYDPAPQDYGLAYEETQGFSPRFRAFSRDLAGRWVRRHGLEGRTVLEIGSGKGEFLVDMCELGAADGIGIDPSYVEERLTSPAAARIRFIRDYYSERYTDLRAHAVVCRHTLEHIAPTGDFVRLIRRSLLNRPSTVVLFELPDVLRVLREVAFWDVYYEHCSYFTPGSLARLFRLAGFDVLDLALDYDGQYILLECRPAADEPIGRQPLEEDPAEVVQAARAFGRGVAAARAHWSARVRAARADGRRPVIWGAGSKGVSFLTTLGLDDAIEYAVDVNPYKHGKYMAGTAQRIVAPEHLREYRPDLVIAMNPIYLDEIGATLAGLGVDAELVAV
jgi:SAM-dependent methyltransferase